MAKIKICGLSRPEDMEYANLCRPDYIGFVFAPSKRQVTPEMARKRKAQLRDGISVVGVFVNEDLDTIVGLCKEGVIDLIQLHGDEDGDYIAALRKRAHNKIIKSAPIKKGLALPNLTPDYFLFDTAHGHMRGGSGLTFDWDVLKDQPGPYFLAGGINLSNIEAAIRKLNPYCIDISSGVETDGKKDLDKMSRVVQVLRNL